MTATIPGRGWIVGLASFSALSAIGGAIELLLWPRGNVYLPVELLAHSPFSTFTVPGLLLGFVIGGTSLLAAVLAARRERAAVDAALFAGGALTIWIAAELAQMREFSFLHGIYGGTGVLLFAFAARAAWQGGNPRHRWWLVVSGAETVGFVVPVLVGLAAARAGWSPGALAAAVIGAGCTEGVCLGTGQAFALPVRVNRARFVAWTALAATLAWTVGMGLSALGQVADPGVVAMVGLPAGALALVGMGALQWLELGRHARGAATWITFSALAWALALPWSFAPSPFVDESTPWLVHGVLWTCGGWLMATTMAIVTWPAARVLRSKHDHTGTAFA